MKKPAVVRPFSTTKFRDLQRHAHELRRLFDWDGNPYADANETTQFNRWHIHNPSVFVAAHHDPRFISMVSAFFGRPMKPSYCFLSMYGRDGICPQHADRPQCAATVDLLLETDATEPWPIYIEHDGEMLPVRAQVGESVMYSGTNQRHYRERMKPEHGTYANLIFFHFVPVEFAGSLG